MMMLLLNLEWWEKYRNYCRQMTFSCCLPDSSSVQMNSLLLWACLRSKKPVEAGRNWSIRRCSIVSQVELVKSGLQQHFFICCLVIFRLLIFNFFKSGKSSIFQCGFRLYNGMQENKRNPSKSLLNRTIIEPVFGRNHWTLTSCQ